MEVDMNRYALRNEVDAWIVYNVENNYVVAEFSNQEDAQKKLDDLMQESEHQVNEAGKQLIPNPDDDERMKKFNWGAFLGGWIWCLCYKQYIVFLVYLIPVILIEYFAPKILAGQIFEIILGLAISIYLGINGNKMAWAAYKDKYQTIENLLKQQRVWFKTFLIIYIVVTVLIIGIAITVGIHMFNEQAKAHL
jgi:hypothetical protein